MIGTRDDPSGWSSLWNAGGGRSEPLALALERRMRQESRRMVWTTVAQTTASMIIVALVGQVALEHRDAFHVVWASGVAVLIASAWAFLLLNRRGVWAPYAETTQSFLTVVTERCRRRLRVVRVVTALAVIHLAFNAWLAWWGFRIRPDQRLHPADAATYIGAVALLIGVIVWAVWYHRRTVQELSRLKEVAAVVA